MEAYIVLLYMSKSLPQKWKYFKYNAKINSASILELWGKGL